MVTDKLAKEFEKIRASLAKSKKLILADIDKIDEKYRRLAQEEKRSLTENLGILNEQLKYYDNMLGGASENAEDASMDEQKSEEEPKIQDTIFPENNEPEEQEEAKETKAADLDAEEDAEWKQKIQSGEIKEVNTDAVVTEDVPQPEQKEKGLTKEDIAESLEAAGIKNIETVNVMADVNTMPDNVPSEQAIEDIPQLNDSDWSDPNNVKTDDDGWPKW